MIVEPFHPPGRDTNTKAVRTENAEMENDEGNGWRTTKVNGWRTTKVTDFTNEATKATEMNEGGCGSRDSRRRPPGRASRGWRSCASRKTNAVGDRWRSFFVSRTISRVPATSCPRPAPADGDSDPRTVA